MTQTVSRSLLHLIYESSLCVGRCAFSHLCSEMEKKTTFAAIKWHHQICMKEFAAAGFDLVPDCTGNLLCFTVFNVFFHRTLNGHDSSHLHKIISQPLVCMRADRKENTYANV